MQNLRAHYFACFGCLALVLSGCVSVVPHKSERSPEIHGRVLDGQTHEPVADALIALQEHRSTAARSDASGTFVLNATHNVHFITFLGICSSSFPPGKFYGDTLEVSHPRYQALQLRALQHLDPRSTNTPVWILRDVSLIPLTK